MDYNEVIIDELRKNNELLKKQIGLLEKLYFVFSKYDEQYLTELEKEGEHFPQG